MVYFGLFNQDLPAVAYWSLDADVDRRIQVIHLVRHGQGFHNVAGHKDSAQYLSFDWYAQFVFLWLQQA